MGRPADYQWRPLGLDRDPVPGDPAQVRQEAQHLAGVAAQISDQVAALRKIADDNTEVGEHADKLHSSAASLAGQLDILATRYQKVSSALNGWAPDLEQAQAMSIQALDQAEGPYQKINQAVVLPAGDNLTAQQEQDVQSYHNSITQAQSQLDAAKALLDRATALRDSSGSQHASLINQACDDGLRDHHSLWGSISGFFSHAWSWVTAHWPQILGDICTVLEVLATAAAIVAFILAQFVPGLDVVVDALVLGAFLATLTATAGRGVLAATGHGSWWDFALDAFACVTFGIGRVAGMAAKAMGPAVEAASKLALTSELLTEVATDGPRAAMLAKFASLEGVDSVEMAYRLGDLAPTVAKGADSLSGFVKVMNSLGGLGEEGDAYAKLLSLGERFTTPISDLSQYSNLAKTLAGVTGISAGVGGLSGLTATVVNGIELDWGNSSWSVAISPLHDWYTKHLEIPTGAPAGG
jgi:hypothetical protein